MRRVPAQISFLDGFVGFAVAETCRQILPVPVRLLSQHLLGRVLFMPRLLLSFLTPDYVIERLGHIVLTSWPMQQPLFRTFSRQEDCL